jgi:cobalamin biosynthesis Co2+ chelatase CbiK
MKKTGFGEMHDKEDLTELQSTVVEAYCQKLAESLPDVEILDAFATNGIVQVKLSDASMQDYSTVSRVVELSIEISDRFNVSLLPHNVPHEN